MSTSEIATKKLARKKLGIVPSTRETNKRPESTTDNALAGIIERLFCQLDLKPLIDDFFIIVHEQVPFSSIEYQYDGLDVTMSIGSSARHSLEYEIVIAEQQLGKISLTRSRVFSNKEIMRLEKLLTYLAYPLRNAAMYYQAIESAFSDHLTGINNRASMNQALPREIQLAQRRKEPLSLLIIDTDNFKSINDNHGHPVGDEVLKTLTEIFKDCVRNTDLVFRYGGDEFIIALPDTPTSTEAGSLDVAERIRSRVEECKFSVDNISLVLSVSIGATQITPTDTFKTALLRADQALLQAKRNGRNQVCSMDI